MPTVVLPEYVGDAELLEGYYEGVIHIPDSVFGADTTGAAVVGGGTQSQQGTDQADTLNGTSGADTIEGFAGGDSINGAAGDDTLLGYEGNDTIEGTTGADWIYGNSDDDSLVGGADADTILGGRGNDSLFGNEGNDYLNGNRESDTLFGGAGNDSIYGGQEADSLLGEAGNDTLLGNLGGDTLTGGDGQDNFVIASVTGGTNLIDADVITDYRPGQDLILLANGLTIENLSFSAGTADQQGNLIIQLQQTNEYLLIVQGVSGNSLSAGNFGSASS